MTANDKQRVVILGGGLGGLSAAYGLTAPEQQDKYEVDVYTMGWRLGGKGASGRNPEIHDRIEEHGLHIWFGCYDNSLSMMDTLFAELERPPEAPLSSLATAFRQQNNFLLYENVEGEWRQWLINFPTNDKKPGGHPSVWDALSILLGWIKKGLASVGVEQSPKVPSIVQKAIGALSNEHKHPDTLAKLESSNKNHLSGFVHALHEHIDGVAFDKTKHAGIWATAMAASLGLLAKFIWYELQDRIPQDDEARRMWIMSYLGITMMRGILSDDLIGNGVDFINAEDGRAWFRRHAALADDTAKDPNGLAYDSPLIRALYDAAFAYEDGKADQPNFSAATLLRACLWLPFSYKGAFCYEMQAGMGDTVFTPLYLALLERGVKFHFFSQVVDVRADGGKLTSIDITQQVNLNTEAYSPLVKVRELLCWPSNPRYEQIEDSEALQGVNLEHYDSGWVNRGPKTTLQAGTDFDHVVFAIPLPAHTAVCADLVAQCPKWQAAVDGVQATRTQAVQLWFNRSRQELGVKAPPVISGAYIEPWSSLADFSHLLLREQWADDDVNYLIYSCGALPTDEGSTQPEADKLVYDSVRNMLTKNSQPLWPSADAGDGFNWDMLWSDDKSVGAERLDAQYWRANIDLNELYILSTSTGIDHRPKTEAAGLKNLSFAGDWTNNGFNISSVEGAVMSGLQASRAISGHPKDIVGEDPKSLTPSDS